jgi:2-methylisocitrate lyase-like PEP mutase family enzyme
MANKSEEFRAILNGSKMLLRPCAYDALSAILIERTGFSVVGTTGYGISASLIGQPDMGFLGSHEMLERTRTIVNAVNIPVDVDIDTGYGNALNVHWAVVNFSRVGAAGVRIEDQIWPKRCGHMSGKKVISKSEMVEKVKAAVRARLNEESEIVIGARTDARAVNGFNDALARAISYAEAGADYVYVEAPQSLGEVEKLVTMVPVPLAFNVIPGGKTPPFSFDKLEELGVRYVSVPMVCLYSATKAMMDALNELRTDKNIDKLASMGVTWAEFNEIVGLSNWRNIELESLSPEACIEMYGSIDLNEIIEKELSSTEKIWQKRN